MLNLDEPGGHCNGHTQPIRDAALVYRRWVSSNQGHAAQEEFLRDGPVALRRMTELADQLAREIRALRARKGVNE